MNYNGAVAREEIIRNDWELEIRLEVHKLSNRSWAAKSVLEVSTVCPCLIWHSYHLYGTSSKIHIYEAKSGTKNKQG